MSKLREAERNPRHPLEHKVEAIQKYLWSPFRGAWRPLRRNNTLLSWAREESLNLRVLSVWEGDPQQRLPGQETVGSPRSLRGSVAQVRAELREKMAEREPMAGNASHRHLQNRQSETSRNANQAHLPACPRHEVPMPSSHAAAQAPSWLQGERRENAYAASPTLRGVVNPD